MSSQPQNVVWLNTDHYAYAHHVDLPGPQPSTPTLDRLSESGTRFERAATPTPLCAPARASLLTGQYPHNHELLTNSEIRDERSELPTDEEYYSHALREADYRTGYFGKWHVGHNDTTAQDYGFEGWSDNSYGYPYGSERYAEYLESESLPEPVVDVEWARNDSDLCGRVPLVDEPGPIHRMDTTGVFETPKETHESYFVAHLANEWIRERASEDEPFFARIDTWGPHHPHWVPPEFADEIDPAAIPEYPNFDHDLADRPDHHREYYELAGDGTYSWEETSRVLARCYEHISTVEAALATTLDTLEALGIADDTLVIYTADHGDLLGAHGGGFDKGWLMVEETMRVPMAMRWPGEVAAGAVSDEPVTNMDAVPTIYEAAGLDVPGDVDARSLLGYARNPDETEVRPDLFCEHHGHYDTPVFSRYLRRGDYKFVAHLDDKNELYDLAKDPYEQTNRIDDPELADLRDRLADRLVERMDEFGDDSEESAALRESLSF